MDFLGPLIFIVLIIASAAKNLQEGKQKKEALENRKERLHARSQSNVKTATPASRPGTPAVRQARPKGAGRGSGPGKLSPNTSGKELIDALFGEGATEKMEGWMEVPPVPAPKKSQAAPPHRAPEQRTENPRESAKRQREGMEQQYARDNDHSSRGHAQGISHQQQQRRPIAQGQPPQQRQYSDQERQRIAAERQRRKAQQQQQAQAKAQQQRPARRAVVAPVATGSFIPQTLPDVRRAIIMAEILGSPKAFE